MFFLLAFLMECRASSSSLPMCTGAFIVAVMNILHINAPTQVSSMSSPGLRPLFCRKFELTLWEVSHVNYQEIV